ncbi:MAG: radical SAM protein [Lewinellaceae bacterium]|nr:radical SAM protein [Lewinellaceae bacterium]
MPNDIPQNLSGLINIAELCPSSEALGPGKRFVIWVQGCPFECKGCIAPDWIPFRKAHTMSIEELAERIVAEPEICGLTISGGEPFMQASRLATLLRKVKAQRPSLNVITFSGFRINQLNWQDALALLAETDVLIAGLFVEKLNNGRGLKGSSNQTVHFLTPSLLPFKEELENGQRGLEFHLRVEGGHLMVGIP